MDTEYLQGFPQTARRKTSLNRGWRYHPGACTGELTSADFDDSSWEEVSLPHSYRLTSLDLDGCKDDKYQKTFHRDISYYRRSFRCSGRRDVRVYLEFEGAHQVTDLWINGEHIGQHAIGGYTPFHFDISSAVDFQGENSLVLRLDNRRNPDVPPDGGPYDYVKFGGLYRSVYLVEKDELQFEFPWEHRNAALRITTPTVKPHQATVAVETTLANLGDSVRECSLLTRVLDHEGRVVLKMESPGRILPGQRKTFYQTGGFQGADFRLWSCEDPYLYRVHSMILEDHRPVDALVNPLGIRKVELLEGQGFFLNGKPLTLIGGNRHQHYPYIGDAVPDSLHRQDALQMKEAGFNVVRLAHYPHCNAFIEACDELGIFVYEEAPSWIEFGSELWMDRLEEAQRRMIRNHRNHPSILIWAAGINHRGPVERMQYAAKEEDPSRWTATNGCQWCGPQTSWCCDILSTMDYQFRPLQPEFVFMMEHGGSADGERNQHYINYYLKHPQVFGMTFWTSHDHSTFNPKTGRGRNRTDKHMCDLFRLPRPAWHWYRSELTKAPMVFIRDSWNDLNGEVVVFSNCGEVELFLNGRSLGRNPPVGRPIRIVSTALPSPFSFLMIGRAAMEDRS